MELYRNFTSQEEIDGQYNPAQCVPNPQQWLDWYRRSSIEARSALNCTLGLRYGPTVDEVVDLFPAARTGAPVLVFFHGGYWRWGSSLDFSMAAAGPVGYGITVAVANYSLCPAVTISEITRQSRALIAWLYNHVSEFNGNPEQIYVAGHSAGGQLVGMLLATDWPGAYGLPADLVKGGIAVSGIFDLRPLRYSYLQPKLQLTLETVFSQSPLFNIPAPVPPLLAAVGEQESTEFHRQAHAYLKALQTSGVQKQGDLLSLQGKHHFSAIDGLVNKESVLCRAIAALLGLSP